MTDMTPTSEFSTPDVDPSILIALGRLAVRWGWLEAILEDLIAGLLGTETALIYLITSDLAIGTRLKHLGLLAKLLLGEKEDLEAFLVLVGDCTTLCGLRNALIHGLWLKVDNNPDMAEVRETRPTKTARLRDLGMYCNRCYLDYIITEAERLTFRFYQFGKIYKLIGEQPDS